MFRAIWVALVCSLLAGSVAGPTAAEAQGRAASGSAAKIYVILPRGLTGSLFGFDVAVDDRMAGKLTPGSYILTERPAGRHKVAIKPPLSLADAVHVFHATAGRSYYFIVNTKSSTMPVVSGGVVTAIPMRGTFAGRPVSEQNLLSGIHLGQLDEAAGRAMLPSLKRR